MPDRAAQTLQDTSSDTLKGWFADRPFDWSIAFSLRAAIRVLPSIFEAVQREWLATTAIPVFHSIFSSLGSYARPIKGHKKSADVSARLLQEAARFQTPEGYFCAGLRNISLAVAAKAKIDKIDRSVLALELLDTAHNMDFAKYEQDEFVWNFLRDDISLALGRGGSGPFVPFTKTRAPSLRDQMGVPWFDSLLRALDRLVEIDVTFTIWRDWMVGVAAGRRLNFLDHATSGDAPLRDREISLNVVQELELFFWQRSPDAVNSDITRWIERALAGVTGHPEDRPSIPAQNDNVISFQTNASGIISLSGSTYFGEVRQSADALDRYSLCKELAIDLKDRCERNNAGARIATLLSNYIEAAGSSIEGLRPSLFVQRGDRLRKELIAYSDPQTMLAPLADDLLLDLQSWQASHNMFVGLDPTLMTRDNAIVGPDRDISDITPREIKEIVADADNAGILAPDVFDVVTEAANLAPSPPQPQNRRTIWSIETSRNLIIEAFNLAFKYPGRALTGGVVAGVTISSMSAGALITASALSSYPAAKFLLRHREWIETRMGDTPTWQTLFVSLCEWLDRNTPAGKDAAES